MKRLVIITGIIVYILFAISAFIAIASEEETVEAQVVTATEWETAPVATEESYIVRTEKGFIVVADNNKKVLWKTDTLVSMLPKEDIKRLKKGITARNRDELRSILEDFCSW